MLIRKYACKSYLFGNYECMYNVYVTCFHQYLYKIFVRNWAEGNAFKKRVIRIIYYSKDSYLLTLNTLQA